MSTTGSVPELNDLINVTLIVKRDQKELKDNIKIQKGCSFENESAIYYATESGNLSIFNKSTKKWTSGNNITMDDNQYSVFKAVANNKFEKTNGKIECIVLSKEDINIAKAMSKKDLDSDLRFFLEQNENTKSTKVQSNVYANLNGVSANVSDGKFNGKYIFKYGEKNDALSLSEKVHKNNDKNTQAAKKQEIKPDTIKAKNDSTKQSVNITKTVKEDPTHKNYVSVNIIVGKNKAVQPVKIEKECSFENKNFIYRIDKSGELKAYNKSTKKWAKCDSIAMTNYQYDTFRAVANNRFERTNGEIKDIILSKEDIERAKLMKESDLKKDLQQFLRVDGDAEYEAVDIKQYKDKNGFSTYVTNNNASNSERLIFTHGDEKNTENVSSKENKSTKKSKTTSKSRIKPTFGQKVKNFFNLSDVNKDGLIIKDVKSSYKPYLDNIATRTGYSSTMLYLIISLEKYTPKAKWKEEGKKSLWEVGFGHTTLASHNNKFGKDFELPLEKAFEWFETDIKDFEQSIRHIGNKYYNYDNLPQSLKDAIIETAYNRGPGTLQPGNSHYDKNYNKLRDDIKNRDYASAAVHLRQAESKMAKDTRNGLRKRNVNRFLMAIRDLSAQDRIKAMDTFNKDGYYSRTISNLCKTEADVVKKNWNNFYNKAKEELKKD